MIYLVVPEDTVTPDEFCDYTAGMVYLPAFDELKDADEYARDLAKVDGIGYTVRKLSTVSYHKGKR